MTTSAFTRIMSEARDDESIFTFSNSMSVPSKAMWLALATIPEGGEPGVAGVSASTPATTARANPVGEEEEDAKAAGRAQEDHDTKDTAQEASKHRSAMSCRGDLSPGVARSWSNLDLKRRRTRERVDSKPDEDDESLDHEQDQSHHHYHQHPYHDREKQKQQQQRQQQQQQQRPSRMIVTTGVGHDRHDSTSSCMSTATVDSPKSPQNHVNDDDDEQQGGGGAHSVFTDPNNWIDRDVCLAWRITIHNATTREKEELSVYNQDTVASVRHAYVRSTRCSQDIRLFYVKGSSCVELDDGHRLARCVRNRANVIAYEGDMKKLMRNAKYFPGGSAYSSSG
eukprot:CAMPEP_0167790562 /NCGR_PEP_ID=MMETSP0111_2-20121227/11404_1 /TAXON_ID=91324 /ORGANISM="Lotharella globosa, Strain CCCM811" /LENGTH=338 /DNA_ID=CAMNT_0007683043 /DNA_START=19 /DNA_END=1032 /DNA_ORIENTATION=-